MKWQFLIWAFLLGTLSAPFSIYPQQQEFIPGSFQSLHLGMSYEEVKRDLKTHRVFLRESNPELYHLSIPIYDLLSVYDGAKNPFVDAANEKIYYDDQVFFDLRALLLSNDNYSLSYKSPYYIADFPHIRSYQVAYANRLNPLLYSLRLKFFQNNLYAIEYRVQLSFLEFNRMQNNYFKRYHRILTPGDQTVEAKGVISLIHVDRNDVTIVLVSQALQTQIFSYLNQQTDKLTLQLYKYVSHQIQEGKNSKFEILESKKQKLKDGLKQQFQAIDML